MIYCEVTQSQSKHLMGPEIINLINLFGLSGQGLINVHN